jgi:cell division protein FtsI (penicillin-binding protein 3)
MSHGGAISLPPPLSPVLGTVVPNFSGYSKRELLPLFLRDDIHLEMSGNGWVRRQSPPPGTPLEADTVIVLELE